MRKIFMTLMLLTAIVAEERVSAQTKIIAHRGYWNTECSAQNSIEALRRSAEAGFYGSEFDVLMTRDGVLVVNHDDTINDIDIQNVDYKSVKNELLPNGEKLPTLKEYLAEGKRHAELKLILELKPLKSKEFEDQAVAGVMEMLKRMDLEPQVEIISFSMNICEGFVAAGCTSPISYLMSDIAPAEIKAKGIAGVDYYFEVFAKRPEWLAEAKELGVITNSWTVNDLNVAKNLVDMGIDYLTTDYPEEMRLYVERR